MTDIRFADWMSPFDVAFYDMDRDLILIDRCLDGKPELKHVLLHEVSHSVSRKKFDLLEEFKASNFSWKLIRYKPLYALNWLCPVVAAKTRGETIVGIEYTRLVVAIIEFLLVLLLILRV